MKKLLKNLFAVCLCLLLVCAPAMAKGYEVTIELPVTVRHSGAVDTPAEEYRVNITRQSATDPMPDPDELVVGRGEYGKAQLVKFTFTRPGVYKYVVNQEKGDNHKIDYDNRTYYVTFVVVNDGEGGLAASVFAKLSDDPDDDVKLDDVVFDNEREPDPTPAPTEEPTPEPTEEPTPEPTEEPTPEPTEEPTPEPTEEPTPEPTEEPTPEPTDEPKPTNTPKPGTITKTGVEDVWQIYLLAAAAIMVVGVVAVVALRRKEGNADENK